MMVQFSVNDPEYVCKNNKIISQKCSRIENILKKRYPETSFCMGYNCLEGKLLYEDFVGTEGKSIVELDI